MTSKQLLDAWLKFWFAPQSPIPIALFRIFYGCLVVDSVFFHWGPDILDWCGMHGVTVPETVHHYWWLSEPRFDIFLLADSDAGVMYLWYLFAAASVCLAIGLFSRGASIIVCLYFISLNNRQPFAINGGDSMMRILSGYLMFAPAGDALSVDRLIKRWRQPTFGEQSRAKPSAPWGQRMIQVQMTLSYWATECAKLSGPQWLDGTAIYYATRLDDMINHTLFLYDNLLFCKLLTWYTLLVEGSMCCLVWVRDFRYYVLGAAVILHLGIDYSINLPIFEYVFMSSFLTFIYPEDLTKCMDWIKKRVTAIFGVATTLVYNPESSRQTSLASVIEGLDVLGRLNITATIPEAGERSGLSAKTAFGTLTGGNLFAWLTARLPLLWPLFLVIGLPWRLVHHKAKTTTGPDSSI